MRIHFITPYKMQWVDGYQKTFSDWKQKWTYTPEDSGADVTVFFWCNEDTIAYINKTEKKGKWIVFVRRYEFYFCDIKSLDWNKVDAVIIVNDFIGEMFKDLTGVTPHIIYNAIVTENWTFKKRKHGNKVAAVGFVHQKKNYPLALQIMAELPRDYELHIVGGVQEYATMEYVVNISKALNLQVFIHGQIPFEDVNQWLEDKNYLLCTSVTEGCPNNVIEAMAKGIKPIVHNWPGAKEQFGKYVFNTVLEAVNMIHPDSEYDSDRYSDVVHERFGKSNYIRFRQIVERLIQ